jgi:Forkhead domain
MNPNHKSNLISKESNLPTPPIGKRGFLDLLVSQCFPNDHKLEDARIKAPKKLSADYLNTLTPENTPIQSLFRDKIESYPFNLKNLNSESNHNNFSIESPRIPLNLERYELNRNINHHFNFEENQKFRNERTANNSCISPFNYQHPFANCSNAEHNYSNARNQYSIRDNGVLPSIRCIQPYSDINFRSSRNYELPHMRDLIDEKSNSLIDINDSYRIVHSRSAGKKRMRPPHPYPYLIAEILQAAPNRELTLGGVYRELAKKYPKYYCNAQRSSWKNTVRYNLSRSGIFERIIESEGVKTEKKKIMDLQTQTGPGRRQSFWHISPEWREKIETNGLKMLLTIGDARKSRTVCQSDANNSLDEKYSSDLSDSDMSDYGLNEKTEEKPEIKEDFRMTMDWLLTNDALFNE